MKGNYKHGMRHTRIYTIWRAMRQRCSNPKCVNYARYGGRGISVCNEWESFSTFLAWAKENGYNDTLTLDRKDVGKGYDPSNCRWITQKEQQNNRTNNKIIELNGTSHTLAEWSDITGIKKATIWARLKNGWSEERTITEPSFVGKNQYRR